ncbi:hypothetical protein ACJJTC_017187 [Scirpophaga incertulas]
MITRIGLALFIAPCILCGNGNNVIDPDTLRDVFGNPEYYSAASQTVPVISQVSPVIPASETLTDPDYWDVDELPAAAVADYDKFDWSITKRVASTSDANFLLSPLGLKLALAILTEAATGATKTELSQVLGYELDRNAVRRKYASIIESLQKESPQYILNLGSRIYIDDSAQPRQRFAAIAQQFYRTELKSVDFHQPIAAAKSINDWVANVTHGRITNLINPDDVSKMVVLILNTLYFKGSWRHQFAPNATRDGLFYSSPKLSKSIPFMNVKSKFFFAESTNLDAKILRMPYLGNKFAMYVIVPNSLTGLPRVLEGITNLRPEIDALQERLVDVTLPKFKFDYTSHLDGLLKDMGVRQAFEDTASFPGIARGQSLVQRLRITKVLQRSGIEVNELGSVAYSATEISLVNKFGEDDDAAAEVVANKPFFFFIQDETTRQLLFTGRVADPALVDGALKLS